MTKKLVIDRQRWLRGEDMNPSYMYRSSDGKMCCLGFYALSCGLKITEIADKKVPSHVEGRLPQEMNWLVGRGQMNSDDGYTLFCTNDDYRMSEGDREKEITEIFAKHDVEVEFVN